LVIGAAFPAIWGFFFLVFSMNPENIEPFCTYLNDWGFGVSVFFLTTSIFYLFIMGWTII
jgi:hypothetical protein